MSRDPYSTPGYACGYEHPVAKLDGDGNYDVNRCKRTPSKMTITQAGWTIEEVRTLAKKCEIEDGDKKLRSVLCEEIVAKVARDMSKGPATKPAPAVEPTPMSISVRVREIVGVLSRLKTGNMIVFYPYPWAVDTVGLGDDFDKFAAAISEYFHSHSSLAYQKTQSNYVSTSPVDGDTLRQSRLGLRVVTAERVAQLLIANPDFKVVEGTSFFGPSWKEPTPVKKPPTPVKKPQIPVKKPPTPVKKPPTPVKKPQIPVKKPQAKKPPPRPRWSPKPKCPLHKERRCYAINRICNPTSGYCVLRDRPIGREVLKIPGYVQYRPEDFDHSPIARCPCGPASTGLVDDLGDYQFGDIANRMNRVPWFIISKPGCSYCKKAEGYLNARGVRFGSITLDASQRKMMEGELRGLTSGKSGAVAQLVAYLNPSQTPLPAYPMIFKCPLADREIRPGFSAGVAMRCKVRPIYIGGYTELEKEPELWGLLTTSPLHVRQPKPGGIPKQQYLGNPWTELTALLYLNHRFKNNCTPIPAYILDQLKKMRDSSWDPKKRNPNITWNTQSLEWDERKSKLIVPPGFWTAVKDCLARVPKVRFLTMPLGYTCKNGKGHANFLIFDRQTGEMERFEPNGSMKDKCFNPPRLNKILQDAFNKNVSKDMVKRVLSPLDFCLSGFQYTQFMEEWDRGFYRAAGDKFGGRAKKHPNDPGGWCSAWSVWYAELRLLNPNKTREQIVALAHNNLEEGSQTFTAFIRSYAAFIGDAAEELRISKNPGAVFNELLLEEKFT